MSISLYKKIVKAKWAYLFVMPSLLFFLVFSLFPLLFNIGLSFFKYDLAVLKFEGFSNFVKIFKDSYFHTALINTFIYVIGLVPLTIITSLLAAVFVRQFNSRLQSYFRFSFYLPTVLSGAIIGTIWVWIFNPIIGPLNNFLGLLGIPKSGFLGNPDLAIVLLVIVYYTIMFGTPFIIYTAALNNIPESFYDAAKIDGASSLQVIRYITIPLIKPTTGYLVMTNTISVFQIWAIIHIMTGGGPLNKTLNLSYLMYKTGLMNYEFGVAAAQGVILFIIILIIALYQFKKLTVDFEY